LLLGVLALAAILFAFTNIQTLPFLYNENIEVIIPSFLTRGLREVLIFSALFYVYLKFTTKDSHVVNCVFITFLCLSTVGQNPHYLAWGLKFFLPLIIFISPSKKLPALSFPLKQTEMFLEGILYLHVFLQVLHFFLGRGYYSVYSFGLNARNPGIMLYPAASSFLTLALFALLLSATKKIKPSMLILTSLSILLCSSITGLVTYLIVIAILHSFFTFKTKIALSVYFVFSFFSLHFARYVPRYIGTTNSYLKETAGGRFQLFKQAFMDFSSGPFTNFFNLNFGKNTNASAQFSNGSIMDSLYTAVLANFNSLWVIAFFILVLLYIYAQKILFIDKKFQAIIAIFLLCSVGLIVTEVSFPFLLLFIAKVVSSQEVIQ
jgi:hypothetical protein